MKRLLELGVLVLFLAVCVAMWVAAYRGACCP